MQLLVTGEQAIISIGGGLIKVYVTIRDVKISKWTKEKKLKKKKLSIWDLFLHSISPQKISNRQNPL
jgi:hypothetical protein